MRKFKLSVFLLVLFLISISLAISLQFWGKGEKCSYLNNDINFSRHWIIYLNLIWLTVLGIFYRWKLRFTNITCITFSHHSYVQLYLHVTITLQMIIEFDGFQVSASTFNPKCYIYFIIQMLQPSPFLVTVSIEEINFQNLKCQPLLTSCTI